MKIKKILLVLLILIVLAIGTLLIIAVKKFPNRGGCFSTFAIVDAKTEPNIDCLKFDINNCNSPSISIKNHCGKDVYIEGENGKKFIASYEKPPSKDTTFELEGKIGDKEFIISYKVLTNKENKEGDHSLEKEKKLDANEKAFSYSMNSNPAIGSNLVLHSWLDNKTGYLYVVHSSGYSKYMKSKIGTSGISIIDTKKTKSIKDDELVKVLEKDDHPRSLWLDSDTGYLYINTFRDGLMVFDTKKSDNAEYYEHIFSYLKTSTPAIASEVNHSWIDKTTKYLYISTSDDGLSVVDTKNTKDVSDDKLVITYSTDSNPAITNNKIEHSWINEKTGYLYISTYNGGLSVVDTKNTKDVSDDKLVITYSTDSNPAITNNKTRHSWINEKTGYLYISTISYPEIEDYPPDTGGGLSVIDTKNTKDVSDDELVITYSTDSDPALNLNAVYSSWIDDETGFLYINTGSMPAENGGLSVVDTKNTKDVSDDKLVITYSTDSDPAITDNRVYHSWIDKTTKYLYVSTYDGGLSVIDTAQIN